MAGVTPRTILVCSFPAIITLLTFLWVRKKKKSALANKPILLKDSDIQHKEALTIAQDSEITTIILPPENNLLQNKEDTANSFQESITTECYPEVNENLVEHIDLTLNLETVNSVNNMGEDKRNMNEAEALVAHSSEALVEHSPEGLVIALNKLSLETIGSLPANHECENLCEQVKQEHENEVHSENNENVVSSEQNDTALPKIESIDSSIVKAIKVSRSEDQEVEISESSTCKTRLPADDNAFGDKISVLALSQLNVSNCDSVSKVSRSEDQESSNADAFPELDDMIESPPPSIYSDAHSEDSSDSGKGGSDIQGSNSNYDFSSSSPLSTNDDVQQVQVYEFELSPDLCGRLIGRMGKHVNYIKSQTNANVFIKRHPFNPNMKICSVEGARDEIKSALEMIRKRFPINEYNNVSLVQVNLPLTCGVMVPETLQLNLPIGVTCDVILSSMVSAGHFFVQQPTHPTYPSLSRLDLCMSACYSQIDTPPMPQPVEVGVICAAPTMGGWYRAQVVNIYDNLEDCDIKFVDYGGYSCIPLSSLRQIRSDFMTLPFQASECYLANVKPIEVASSTESSTNGGWSVEACATFEELAQGQILQALVVDHAEDGVPFVHLYRVQGVSTVFINRELVNQGVSHWVEYRQE